MKKLILILFLITSQIWATNYYIDPNHPSASNSNMGTAPGSPWADQEAIHNNWSNFTGGDVIYIAEGTRLDPASSTRIGIIQVPNNYQNGSRYNKIKFTSYIGYGGAGAKPVVSNKRIGSGYYQPLRISAAAYLEFENIRFESFYGENVVMYPHYGGYGNGTVGVHDIIFRNCEFETGNFKVVRSVQGVTVPQTYVPDMNAQNANTAPVYRIWMIDGLFEATRAEDAMSFPSGNRGRNDGSGLVAAGDTNIFVHGTVFYDTQEEALDISGGSDHLVEYNYVSGTFGGSTNGMKFHSQTAPLEYSVIRYNAVSGVFYTNPYYNKTDWANNGSVIGSSSYGLVLWNVQNCEIYNNTLYNRYGMIMGDDERTDQTAYFVTTKNNVVRNNNIYGCFGIAGDGDVIQGGWTHNQEDSLTILNTLSNNNYHTNAQFFDWRLVRVTRNSAPQEALCVSDDGNPVGGSLGTWTNVWINGKYAQTGKGELNVNPDLVSPTWTGVYGSHDHSLNSTSPLRDAGTSFSSTLFPEENVDIAGNTRISGTAPDIGAYEYQAGDVPGQLTFSPESITMGTVSTSETQTATLTINNIGTTDSVIISAITLTGDSSSLFTINDIYVVVTGIQASVSTPYELEAGSTMYVEVQFDGSTATGAKSCNLSIDHDSNVMSNDPFLIPVSVTVSDAAVVYAISGDTAKVFTTALGAEELTNWDLTNWSATDPDGWTIQGEDPPAPPPSNYVDETTTGSGVARLVSDGTYVSMKQYNITASGGRYLFEIDIDAVTLGSIKFTNGSQIKTWNTPQVDKFYFVADGSHGAIERGSSSGSHQVDINYVSIKEITSSWNATATITATGSLTCDDIQLTNGTNFGITSATSFSLNDGETFDLTYSFAPSDTGYFKDTIVISGINASNKTVDSLFIEGYFESGYTPTATKNLKTIGLTGSTFSIANTDTGSTTSDSLQFYNDGDANLTLDSLVWSGGDSDQFTLLSLTTNDTTLSAGDTTDLGIKFEPTSSGVKTAYLSVYHNGDNIASPLVITVTAQATVIQTEPYVVFLSPTPSTTLNFGTVEVNSTVQGRVIWRNDGDNTFIYQVSQTTGTVFDYVSGGLNDSTQTDELDTLIYSFTPNTTGSFSDTLRFTGSTSNRPNPFDIILIGTGISTDANFAIDYSSYYFGVQDTSDQDTLTVTITNDRADALSGVISIPTSEVFTLLDGGSYSTFTTKTFRVLAQPTDEMYYEIDVTITHNATNVVSPQTLTVGVTGDVVSKLAVIPTNYHFGSVYLGDSKTSSDIILYNKGRNTITVDSVYLATNSVFTIADTLGASLPGNLVYAGGFDKDTLWTFTNAQITDYKLQFTGGSLGSASQTISELKDNNAYLVVVDISNHTGSGDALTVSLGGGLTESGTMVTLTGSQYSNGTLAIQMYSGSLSDDLVITMFNGNYNTRIDNITVSEYTFRQVTFTPTAGTTLNTDNLGVEHDASNTNPFLVPITGYMTSGGITINGNIEVNTVKKK